MCSSYYSFIKSGVVRTLCLALCLKHSAHITSRILCTLLRVMFKSLCISARQTICLFAIIWQYLQLTVTVFLPPGIWMKISGPTSGALVRT